MKLITALKEFELSLYGEVGVKTRKWYISFDKHDKPKGILRSLKWIGLEKSVKEINVSDLRKWRKIVFEQKTINGGLPSKRTQRANIQALQRFFNWMMEENYIDTNPAQQIKIPKSPDPNPNIISKTSVEKLLAVANTRDKAIILFLADTGCRVGGVRNLQEKDVYLDNNTAIVWEKGKGGNGKSRPVFFKRRTRNALEAYMEKRPNRKGTLFQSSRKKADLTEDGIRRMLQRLAKKANITEPVNPHAFRHAAARNWLQNGADLATVSQLLGHASVKTTSEYYARWSTSQLKEWHSRISTY